MKGKFSCIWRVVIALVLASSLGMVMAVPAAANVSAAAVTPLPNTAAAPAQYTIVFTTLEDLAKSADDDVRIEFPAGTTVPGSYLINSISINGTDVSGTPPVDVDIVGQMFTIDVPKDIPHGTVTVVFKLAAGIVNPSTPGLYTLDVSTSREVTWVESQQYEIIAGPVALFLKYQHSLEECGYVDDEYEFIASYDTIQEALNEADTLFGENAWKLYTECPTNGGYIGAKIKVYPGTYDPIVIDTPGVEVVSTGGAGVTFIDGTVEPSEPAAVFISAGGVTFNGFTVKNAGVGIPADSWMDFDSDGIADIKGIQVVMLSEKNNAFIYDKDGNPIVDCSAYDARVNILNNVVYGGKSMGIAVFNSDGGACVLVNGNNVHDNQWDGFWASMLRQGVDIVDPAGPITGGLTACSEITNNTFADNGQGWNELNEYTMASSDNGIQIMSATGSPKTLYIVGNTISGNSNAGIYLGDGINDMVVIKFNQIEDNDVFGISSHMTSPYNIACVYNDIMGNGVWGIKNWYTGDGYLVAALNYWGDLSGPSCGPAPAPHEASQQSEALGKGDAVSHYVIYKWWLTSSFEDVQTDLIRYYGSDCYGSLFSPPTTPIVPLEQGWNTMSTPVPLDERADQMGEILALGGWMQNYILGYSYDPASGWQLVTGSYQLLPLKAIYVKMAGPDILPILLRTTNYMPARNLAAGWNLVSLNAPFWTEGISSMSVDQALSSIEGSWGNAISPAMPGQQDSWVCTPSTAGGKSMYIGDGYWVFITKPTILAGFRMAPWYLDDWEMAILNCQLPPWMMGP